MDEKGDVMRKIGMFKAMSECSKYQKMEVPEKEKLQKQRLQEMVEWARNNSPYYAQKYKAIGDNYQLEDLPPVNKVELMANWDSWVTDQTIKLTDIMEFMKDLDNIGRKFRGKYIVFTTSGSTGNPLVALCDQTTDNVMGGVNATRSICRKEDMKAFISHGGKTIGVFANEGFYLGNSSVRSRLLKMPWKKKQMAVTSALLPIEQIVKELNEFQPAMLGGYPSNLDLLIDEQKKGTLHIHPILIMTGGEYLSDSLRKELSKTFGCYVQTSYSCTEGGTIACECRKQHFHINDDWLIVEPVDKDNKPVPDGVLADKILLTNLYNFTQPFIRYEVTDRIVMHHEACGCGNPSPWITLEGRTDDVVSFIVNGEVRKVPPLAIYATLKEVHALQRFQLVVHQENQIEFRMEEADGVNREKAFEQGKEALLMYLKSQGVEGVTVTLSEEKPRQQAGSGKFKHIIKG